MSPPNGQVTWLRNHDSPKFGCSLVKIRRTCIPKREAGALIESVYKVGAIGGQLRAMVSRIQRGAQNRQTLIWGQQLRCRLRPLLVRVLVRDSFHTIGIRPVFLLLRSPRENGRRVEQKNNSSAFGVELHSSVITNLIRATQVTGVPTTPRKVSRIQMHFRVKGVCAFLPRVGLELASGAACTEGLLNQCVPRRADQATVIIENNVHRHVP